MNNIPIRVATVAGLLLLGLLMVAAGGWGALALKYSGPHNDTLRYTLAAAFAAASLAALIALVVRRWRWRAFTAYLVLFLALLVWYLSLEPSNERDWQTDVAVLSYAEIEGDQVTVHNVRNLAVAGVRPPGEVADFRVEAAPQVGDWLRVADNAVAADSRLRLAGGKAKPALRALTLSRAGKSPKASARRAPARIRASARILRVRTRLPGSLRQRRHRTLALRP